jgi:hypothetical protein
VPTVEELKQELADAEAAEAAQKEADAQEVVTKSGVTGPTLKAVALNPNGETFIERLRSLATKLAQEGEIKESEIIGPAQADIVNPVLIRVVGELVDEVFKGI